MKIYNFSAGPAMLPEAVMRKAQAEFIDFQGSGSGILELSHRGKFFQPVIDRAEANVRELLNVSDDYAVMLLKRHTTAASAFSTPPGCTPTPSIS